MAVLLTSAHKSIYNDTRDLTNLANKMTRDGLVDRYTVVGEN